MRSRQAWNTVRCLVVLLFVAGSALTVSAQPNSAQLRLLDQTDFVDIDQPFSARLEARATGSVDLVTTLRDSVRSRDQLHQVFGGKSSTTSLAIDRQPLDSLRNEDGSVVVELPVSDPAQRRYFLRNEGVYPLDIELREQGSTTGSLQKITTFVLVLPRDQQPRTPLGITTILPITLPLPSDRSLPETNPEESESTEVISAALTKYAGLPLHVAPEAQAIERLTHISSDEPTTTLTRLRAAVGNREVLTTPWVAPNADYYSTELRDTFQDSMDRSRAVLQRYFPIINDRFWVSTTDTNARLNQTLQSQQYAGAIVREESLSPQASNTTLTRPFSLTLGKRDQAIDTGMADEKLSQHFATEGALGAHQLLADLMVLWLDYPGITRGVVVMPQHDWRPDSTFLDQYLRALSGKSILSPLDLHGFFALNQGKSSSSRTLKADRTTPTPSAPYDHVRHQRDGFSTMVDTAGPAYTRLTQQYLYSTAAGNSASDRQAWVNAFHDTLRNYLSHVTVPRERSIRLTSRSGVIPVSVQNDNGFPVRARIELVSGKLDFSNGATRLITVERSQLTERYPINSKTSGAFPVQVRLTSPDGSLEIASSSIMVRSTVTSAIGVFLTVGASVFLMLWWIYSAVSERRRRRLGHPSLQRPHLATTSTPHQKPESGSNGQVQA